MPSLTPTAVFRWRSSSFRSPGGRTWEGSHNLSFPWAILRLRIRFGLIPSIALIDSKCLVYVTNAQFLMKQSAHGPNDETDIEPTFLSEVNEFNIAILSKVLSILSLKRRSPRCFLCTRSSSHRSEQKAQEREKWPRVLPPSDLQPTVVQSQALEGCTW